MEGGRCGEGGDMTIGTGIFFVGLFYFLAVLGNSAVYIFATYRKEWKCLGDQMKRIDRLEERVGEIFPDVR